MTAARAVSVAVALAACARASAQGFWDPRPRHGGQATFGLGLIGASVAGGGASVSGAGGAGVQLVGELRIVERLAWDLRLGGFDTTMKAPAEIDYPDDSGSYALASTGLHYDVVRSYPWAAWLGAEATLHYASMEHYGYAVGGYGLGPALGADLDVAGPISLRASAHLSWPKLSSGYGDELGRARAFWAGVDLLYVMR
jgi:hypothetical protein